MTVYLSSQVFVSGIFFFLIGNATQKDKLYQENYANIESNKDVMKYFVEPGYEYVKVAFKKLESEFNNPNDFKLHRYSTHGNDSSFNNSPETSYTVWFTYSLKGNEQDVFFSKLKVFRDTAIVEIFNRNIHDNDEYMNRKKEVEKEERESVHDLKRFLDTVVQQANNKKSKRTPF